MAPFNNHTEKNRNQQSCALYDMQQLLNEEAKIILDGGANKGQSALEFTRFFKQAKIYCFEPHTEVFNQLKEKYEGNSLIECICCAIGESEGETGFFINKKRTLNSTLSKSDEAELYVAKPKDILNVEKINTPMTTLDNFLLSKKMDKIDILKLDLQGGELNALKGALKSLTEQRISLIFTEISFVRIYQHAPLFHDICSFLSGLNYSLFDVYGLINAGNGQLKRGDALFISPKIRENINQNLKKAIQSHFG